MKALDCHVLVVGAGPAGACAAREAAASGADVLVVERRAEIGVPVRCAEYIPALLLGEVDVGREPVVQFTKGMRTFLNGEPIQELAAPGCMVRRDLFDQALAASAGRAGARFLLGTTALSFDGHMLTALGKDGAPYAIHADVVVGADGPHSKVGRWIGSMNRNCIPALQVRMRLTRPLDHTEIFFDDRIYGGYGWLFPRGEEANVGLGMKRRGHGGPKLRAMLRELLALLASRGKIRGEPTDATAGWIPAEAPRRITRGNVLLAGDAAGHTHPITGAGVLQAVIGGQMAGKWAARAAATGEWEQLVRYEAEWNGLYGETLRHGHMRRLLLERHPGRLADIIKHCWIGFREYYAES